MVYVNHILILYYFNIIYRIYVNRAGSKRHICQKSFYEPRVIVLQQLERAANGRVIIEESHDDYPPP